MLNQVKQLVIKQLWHSYMADLRPVSHMQTVLQQQYNEVLSLDHFAIIDLPGPHTGIVSLIKLFSFLDYEVRGQDYLPEKQNEFFWLAEKSSSTAYAVEALPQVVVADFRREALVPEVRKIIDAYASQSKPLNIEKLLNLWELALAQDRVAALELVNLIMDYLKGRDWPLPSIEEFEIVKNYNELLAWVLVMGRQVNHFAWSIHLSKNFSNLQAFNQFVSEILLIALNEKGGVIKGQLEKGIEQSSTSPITKKVVLIDGTIDLPDRFIEFVWRYSVLPTGERPNLWKDYFTGFVANHADRVVESLYLI
ncbi:MAG: DUF1338 domain-containing protein [Rickettsiella sp.]|nr:DUF1338 domain-containing protein [Rickettsiella sp.]